MLAVSELQKLKACFDEEFWSTIPAISGALEACELLASRGYELVCVTALSQQFAPARLKNLKDLGFPIERVIATPGDSSQGSPKARALLELAPIAFGDDFLPYMIGVDERIHRALITRDPVGSPNVGAEMLTMNSTHGDLLSFANWWCRRNPLIGVNTVSESDPI